MSNKEEKEYEERKAIVTKYKDVEFAVILPDTEKTSKIEGAVDVIKGKLGFGGQKGSKRTVQATVVSDPRLPTEGPVPQKAWEDYWSTFLEERSKMQDHIAKVVTHASGVQINSSDVDLRGTFTVNQPTEKIWTIGVKECPQCGETNFMTSETQKCIKCGLELTK